jgi:hypothetical protein
MITFLHETRRTGQNGLAVDKPIDNHEIREINHMKSYIEM